MSFVTSRRAVNIAILVAALGYFVDVFDLLLFSILRVESLASLGVVGEDALKQGVFLINVQMIGMLVGGVAWGVFGDKRGRLQVLFGSIFLYSIANILNAFVDSVSAYAACRFVAGLGLAGEVGAGITLVSELMPKETRGYATTLVATVGVSGAIAAGLVGDLFAWRTAYIIGGCAGLCLLVLRISVHESGMFAAMKGKAHVSKGDLRLLFSSVDRTLRYCACILIATPVWLVVGVVVAFGPEIGKALGMADPVKVSYCAIAYAVGISLGDLVSGVLSQVWQSRKRVIGFFIASAFVLLMVLLTIRGGTANRYYAMLVPIGFFIGYWAVFLTTAAEQFGTNLRATVTTSAPNFVRGLTVLMTLSFNALKNTLGVVPTLQLLAAVVCGIALLSLSRLHETYGRDLDFLEGEESGFQPGNEDELRRRAVPN